MSSYEKWGNNKLLTLFLKVLLIPIPVRFISIYRLCVHKSFRGFIHRGRRTPQNLWNKYVRLLTTCETTATRCTAIRESCPDVIVIHATTLLVRASSDYWLDKHVTITPCCAFVNKYRVIKNKCRGFNNLSYTVHLR